MGKEDVENHEVQMVENDVGAEVVEKNTQYTHLQMWRRLR